MVNSEALVNIWVLCLSFVTSSTWQEKGVTISTHETKACQKLEVPRYRDIDLEGLMLHRMTEVGMLQISP